jgi:predicted small lipoprotein YifL
LVAGAAALVLALGACGQKGPLFLPAPGGPAAKAAATTPSAAVDASPVAAPPQGASAAAK